MEEVEDWKERCQRMVEEQLIPRGIINRRVISAFLRVPRHRFVPSEFINSAYADYPLPIGEEQTISQPYIVALMTQVLDLREREKVLEIGTGSGYQAAILAEMNCCVYSIERSRVLAKRAEEVLKQLGYTVKIKVGDGTRGWKEFSPFSKIVVTASAPYVPPSLLTQLEEGGLMVIPVGNKVVQTLTLIRKEKNRVKTESLCGCRFVPLIGEEGWK
ncbi:MAG: protein-L-isoaspartate O-methyltransferase [Candidatus Omnitrophota bacterium]|nr:MAG: protein-L-isoaspartate O-methyltransferase [Candidatus Omnitrophota bacterium]